ncbi:MAG: M56 family metallopeptidase [Verrucomicrobiales bacterium]
MSRALISTSALLGTALPFLVDSAFKGAGLLLLAGLVALALRRASAAKRHLVWLLALAALIVLPGLSALLPSWRILPDWAVVGPEKVSRSKLEGMRVIPGTQRSATPPAEVGGRLEPRSPVRANGAQRADLSVVAASSLPPALHVSAARNGQNWLPLIWSAGFVLLLGRLFCAHGLMCQWTRRCRIVTDGPLAVALNAAQAQLCVRQRVGLLLDPRRTIPLVWGVFRPQLLLPAEAEAWHESQSRSVFLHELAHIKRRDTAVQWLVQLVCALHWFNPLVWFAAWRLQTERERACDDLVLASGVRPSEYAEHLLEVATKLDTGRWTHACGLAMARRSHLESRLRAVLSEKIDRRSVTAALVGTALLLGAMIVVPFAIVRAADKIESGPDVPAASPALVPTTSAAPTKNEANIVWPAESGRKPRVYEIALREGDAPYRMVWERGSTVVWVAEEIELRRVEFRDAMNVRERHWKWTEAGEFSKEMPVEVRAEIEKRFLKAAIVPPKEAALDPQLSPAALWIEPILNPEDHTIDLTLPSEVIEFDGLLNYGSPIQPGATDAFGNPTRVIRRDNRIEQPIFSTRRLSEAVRVSTAGASAPAASAAGIVINVLDSEQTRVAEFQVIAGVRSGVSSNVEGVVNWQPHTLRIGKKGVLVWPLDEAYDEMALRIEADGYVPQTSAWIKKSEGAKEVSIKLLKDAGVAGRVLTPDGKSAAGATLALAMVQRDAVIENGEVRGLGQPLPEKASDHWRRPVFSRTDSNGRFKVPRLADSTAAALIVHGSGVREMHFADFEKSPEVTLQPWGRIEGRVLWQDKPGANEDVSLTVHRDAYGYPGVIAQYEKTKTDGNGQFTFDKVLPGQVQLARPFILGKPTKSGTTSVVLPGMFAHVTVKPGVPTPALIGGRGRTVKGRLVGRDSWDGVTMHFHPRAPHIGMPGDEDSWTAWTQFQKSSIGPIFFRTGLQSKADGTFEIPSVLPGDYQLFVDGNSGSQFSIESENAVGSPEPRDLGNISVPPSKKN